jgi:gamma-F420-2:alpha-L-glutamate ligase
MDKRKGLIIYKSDEAGKNRAFIEMFIKAFAGKGYALKLLVVDAVKTDALIREQADNYFAEYYSTEYDINRIDLKENIIEKIKDDLKIFCMDRSENISALLSDAGSEDEDISGLSFVINRTRAAFISEYFEERNVCVYNSSIITMIANDKYLTYQFMRKKLSESDHAIADTYLLLPGDIDSYLESDESKKFPVIKTVEGHGGSGVFLSHDIISGEHDNTLKIKEMLKKHYLICQELIDSPAEDVRVYVLNGHYYAAVLRKAKAGFKSNYSLGGVVKSYDPDPREMKLIQTCIDAVNTMGCGDKLPYGFIGIDFIRTGERELLFNEIEEMAGTRMLYKTHDLDIVNDFVEEAVSYHHLQKNRF